MALQAVTAGRHSRKSWVRRSGGAVAYAGPLYGVKIYEARPRQKDHMMVWRLLRIENTTFTALSTVIQAAQMYAARNNLPYLPKIKHGARMMQVIS